MGEPENADGLTFFEVSKSFGRFEALRGFSLRVARGEVISLFGPNGAGKTTLLRIAAGLTAVSRGRVLVDGIDGAAAPSEAKRRTGFAGDRPLLYGELTARENLEFAAQLYGLAPAEAKRVAEEGLKAQGLAHRAADPAGTLSHGMAQALSLARSTVHGPTVLLLDEPFEGLDARRSANLVKFLREGPGHAGRAVLLSTHQVDLGLAACDRVALLDRGRLMKVAGRSLFEGPALSKEIAALGGEGGGT